MKREISVSFYLEDLREVLSCGEWLVHAMATDNVDERDRHKTCFAVASLLGLVGERLRVLRRMIAGEADPAEVWSDRVAAVPGVQNDITLSPTNPEPAKKTKRKGKRT